LRIGDVVSITPREEVDGKVGGKGGNLTPEEVKDLWLRRGKATAKAMLEAEAASTNAKTDAKAKTGKTAKISKKNAAATRPPANSTSTSHSAASTPTTEPSSSTPAGTAFQSPSNASPDPSASSPSPNSPDAEPSEPKSSQEFFSSLSLHRLLQKSQPKHRTKLYQYYARSQSRKMITTRGSRGVKFVVSEVLTPVGYEMGRRVEMAKEAQNAAAEAMSAGVGGEKSVGGVAGKAIEGKQMAKGEQGVNGEGAKSTGEDTGGESSPWWKRKEGRGSWMMEEAAKHNATA
jgi:hypothetical protein